MGQLNRPRALSSLPRLDCHSCGLGAGRLAKGHTLRSLPFAEAESANGRSRRHAKK